MDKGVTRSNALAKAATRDCGGREGEGHGNFCGLFCGQRMACTTIAVSFLGAFLCVCTVQLASLIF